MADYPNEMLVDKSGYDSTALDYAFLRDKAIKLIQQYSGESWTDYNLHDPGITILEHLCYAITDLAYRTRFPITSLLADEQSRISRTANAFFSPEQILTTAPITSADFRKFIIDAVPEINNIWIEPVQSSFSSTTISGRYKVTIQLRQQINYNEQEEEEASREILRKVQQLLHAYRNLAEDFTEFVVLKPQPVSVDAHIIMDRNANPEETLSTIYYLIQKWLAPPVTFFTESELLNKGYSIEAIYTGPLLQHGIIPDDALSQMRKEVDPAELSRVISALQQVVHVQRLEILSDGVSYVKKPVLIKPDHYPVLAFNPASPGIQLYTDNLLLPIVNNIFTALLHRLQDGLTKRTTAVDSHQTAQYLHGTYAALHQYTSIQTLFPALYRIGAEGIEESASPARKAKAKQLKAYLMFFEQILAGFLAQLSHLNTLFSPAVHTSLATYFVQPLYEVPGADTIIKAYSAADASWKEFTENRSNDYVKGLEQITESKDDFRRRKKRILRHFLSRFNIIPDAYPVRLFDTYYNSSVAKGTITEEIKWLSLLLQNVLVLNKYRVKAMDYMADAYSSEPKPGFAYNMSLLLNLPNKAAHYTTHTLHTQLKDIQPSAQTAKSYQSADKNYVVQTVQVGDETLQVEMNDADTTGESVQFNFRRQSAKLFSEGADKSNYRIIPGMNGQDNWLVLYKPPQATTWQVVARFLQKKDAMVALRLFLQKLNKISFETEGFHLVEHLLLAPGSEEKVYGFRFFDRNGVPALKQSGWLTFAEREAVLTQIKKLATTFDSEKLEGHLAALRKLCTITEDKSSNSRRSLSIFDRPESDAAIRLPVIMDSIASYQKDAGSYYPRFEFFFRYKDNNTLNESFFDSGMTIIFPDWPKRFQDESFRQFTENLFRNDIPVHIKPHFFWLDIVRMKQFEDLHADWMTAMKKKNASDRQDTGDALRTFLITELGQQQAQSDTL